MYREKTNMSKNKKKESINLCFKYANCKFCPRCAKCDEELIKPKVEEKGKLIKLEVKR